MKWYFFIKPNKFTLTNHSNRQNARVQHRFGGMKDGRKMAARCGMSEILTAECGIKLLLWEQDVLILIDGKPDSFKIN